MRKDTDGFITGTVQVLNQESSHTHSVYIQKNTFSADMVGQILDQSLNVLHYYVSYKVFFGGRGCYAFFTESRVDR